MPAMATAEAEYELVLMLDPEVPDERREQIAADARQRIESGGALKADNSWGMRKMAYEINQRTEADYRFFRFESGGTPLLDELNHNLRIADGVLRFRIFKVDPRIPVIVPPPPTPLSSGRPERGERGSRRDGPGRGRGDGPPRNRGADDDPVAAPVAPVSAPPDTAPSAPAEESPAPPAEAAPTPDAAPPAEAPAAPEAPAADAPPAPAEPAPEPGAPAADAESETPASGDEQ